MNMKEAKNLLNKGWDNLSPQEQRDVVAFLAERLGTTKDSVMNWVKGGIPRRLVDKPQSYRNVPKPEWADLRDIFSICLDGKKFEEKREVKRKDSKMSTDELMKSIDRMESSVKKAFFGNLYRNDRKMYNEISTLYTNHRKYGGNNKGGRNISRYSKKKENKLEKENNFLTNLQNGGKIKSFGRIL